MRLPFLTLAIMLFAFIASAQIPAKDKAVYLMSHISGSGKAIELIWNDDINASVYNVLKRNHGEEDWKQIATIAAPDTHYVDKSVIPGVAYEYLIEKRNSSALLGYGNILAGIDLKPILNRRIALIIEDSLIFKLPVEIKRLQNDLKLEGWRVIERSVSSSLNVNQIKAQLKTLWQNDGVEYVILIGNIAVPYSGEISPDAHANHVGAWATDAYYADLDGEWTDKTVNNLSAKREDNHNLPLDGKFDQSLYPSAPELIIGRIFLEKFTSDFGFNSDRYELYRNYLNKNHAHRTGQISTHNQLIDNQLANLGEGFASIGYRYFNQHDTASITTEINLFTSNTSQYSLAFMCGFGSDVNMNKVGKSQDFASTENNALFMGMLGSYFGDWDFENNFMRASMAAKNPSLAAFWSGRPNWLLHEFVAGMPLGQALYSTINSNELFGAYDQSIYKGSVHIGLLGDPSLLIRYKQPIASVALSSSDSSTIRIKWEPISQVDVVFLYKMVDNNYQLIAQLNKTDSSFVDSFPIDGDNIYALQLGDVTTTGAYPKVSQLTADTFFNFKRKTISIKATAIKPNLSLFPNPANNFIVIKSEIPLEISTFEIVNAQGIICVKGITNHKTQRVGINIDNLPSGSYVIRFSNKTQNPQMVRFLKE